MVNWGTGTSKSEVLLVSLHILKALYYMQKADYWTKKLKIHCIKWWDTQKWAPHICFIGRGCFVTVQKKGNSPSNRLELLAVLRGAMDLKTGACILAYSCCCLEILYTPTWCYMAFLRKPWKNLYRFQCKTNYKIRKYILWLVQMMSRQCQKILVPRLSLKNSHRKMMLKWVFLSIEPFKSLLLQNLLANSTNILLYFDIINTSCATEKTQILNTCSTSEI